MPAYDEERAILGVVDGLRYLDRFPVLVVTGNEAQTDDVKGIVVQIVLKMAFRIMMHVLIVYLHVVSFLQKDGRDVRQALREPVNI